MKMKKITICLISWFFLFSIVTMNVSSSMIVNIENEKDINIDLNQSGDVVTDYFYMDFNSDPENDPHTVDGGRFENGETWTCTSEIIEGDFDDTDDMPWTNQPGLYSEVRIDTDLSDDTSKKGSWLTCGKEYSGLIGECSYGRATVEKEFNLKNYVDTSLNNFEFTEAQLNCDYKVYSDDFDESLFIYDFIVFNIYLIDENNEMWPLEYQYWTPAEDIPCDGYGTELLFSSVDGPKLDKTVNDYNVNHYVESADNQGNYETNPIWHLFNNNGDTYTIIFEIWVQLFPLGFTNEEFEFLVDDVHIKCEYKYEEIDDPPEPDLDCEGSLSLLKVKPGKTVKASFKVKNVGESESLLDWEISESPDWGTWTFTPSNGDDLNPEDGSVTVQVSVVAPDEKLKSFSGSIKVVNKENSNDYELIQVTLTTLRNKPYLNSLFLNFLQNHPLIQHLLKL